MVQEGNAQFLKIPGICSASARSQPLPSGYNGGQSGFSNLPQFVKFIFGSKTARCSGY